MSIIACTESIYPSLYGRHAERQPACVTVSLRATKPGSKRLWNWICVFSAIYNLLRRSQTSSFFYSQDWFTSHMCCYESLKKSNHPSRGVDKQKFSGMLDIEFPTGIKPLVTCVVLFG